MDAGSSKLNAENEAKLNVRIEISDLNVISKKDLRVNYSLPVGANVPPKNLSMRR
jgi:hypothetical protein